MGTVLCLRTEFNNSYLILPINGISSIFNFSRELSLSLPWIKHNLSWLSTKGPIIHQQLSFKIMELGQSLLPILTEPQSVKTPGNPVVDLTLWNHQRYTSLFHQASMWLLLLVFRKLPECVKNNINLWKQETGKLEVQNLSNRYFKGKTRKSFDAMWSQLRPNHLNAYHLEYC